MHPGSCLCQHGVLTTRLPGNSPPLSLELVSQFALNSCCHEFMHGPTCWDTEVNTAGTHVICIERQNFVPVSGGFQAVSRKVSLAASMGCMILNLGNRLCHRRWQVLEALGWGSGLGGGSTSAAALLCDLGLVPASPWASSSPSTKGGDWLRYENLLLLFSP